MVCSAAPRTRALEVGSPAEHARLCRLRYSAHTAVRAPYTLLVARSKMNDRGVGEIEPRTTGRRPAYLCSVQKKTVQTRPGEGEKAATRGWLRYRFHWMHDKFGSATNRRHRGQLIFGGTGMNQHGRRQRVLVRTWLLDLEMCRSATEYAAPV